MSRIDAHHHVVPPAYAALLTDRGLTPGGVDTPECSPELGLKLMKKVDMSTASLTLSTPGVWFGDAKETMMQDREIPKLLHPIERFWFDVALSPTPAGSSTDPTTRSHQEWP